MARRWLAAGKLAVPAGRVGGLILVSQQDRPAVQSVVVYARVSSAGQVSGLDRQVARVAGWATASGRSVGGVVTEAGPALTGRRAKFLALVGDPDGGVIVVEHRDRLARFGVGVRRGGIVRAGRQAGGGGGSRG
jgi:predicted site-specific integrase-resolvase